MATISATLFPDAEPFPSRTLKEEAQMMYRFLYVVDRHSPAVSIGVTVTRAAVSISDTKLPQPRVARTLSDRISIKAAKAKITF